jgi:hypothetical protein
MKSPSSLVSRRNMNELTFHQARLFNASIKRQIRKMKKNIDSGRAIDRDVKFLSVLIIGLRRTIEELRKEELPQ